MQKENRKKKQTFFLLSIYEHSLGGLTSATWGAAAGNPGTADCVNHGLRAAPPKRGCDVLYLHSGAVHLHGLFALIGGLSVTGGGDAQPAQDLADRGAVDAYVHCNGGIAKAGAVEEANAFLYRGRNMGITAHSASSSSSSSSIAKVRLS